MTPMPIASWTQPERHAREPRLEWQLQLLLNGDLSPRADTKKLLDIDEL